MKRSFLSFFVVLLFASACTDSGIEVSSSIFHPEVDNLLTIHGEVCTQPPSDVEFPVKIMFIVDCSGSMQQTDEGDRRVEAVRQVVRRYANNPSVYFDVIKFNGVVSDLTGGFVHLQGDEANVFGSGGLLQADSMTDYQGALGRAYEALLNDMNKVNTSGGGLPELTRSKYVVIFFSDGTPDPVCFGCATDPASPRYTPECEEDYHVICQTMDATGAVVNLDMEAVFSQHAANGIFPELEEGADYNQNYQLFQLVDAMMDLKANFHVGDMRIHSAFLYCRDQFGNPTSPLCAAAEEAYHLDPDRGRALLREISRRGNGTFRDFTSGQDINFLQIDYTSIKRTYVSKSFLVDNRSARPVIDRFQPDSDGDGLNDEEEQRLGSDPLSPDSDGDYYGDFVEYRLRNAGFDPLDASRPDTPCQDTNDGDGDGMLACEEVLFFPSELRDRTDRMVDVDSDGVPDRIEILMGMDPVTNDLMQDLDSDGQRNLDEVMYHTDPARSDPSLWNTSRYWYELKEGRTNNRDQYCYSFDVRYLSLVTTLDRNRSGSRGFNDIMLWFNQSSSDNPLDVGDYRVACVRPQYIEPDYKVPFNGEITISDTDFKKPYLLDLSFGGDCVTDSRR
ncbi:MAG: VWA domain-containing protein [Myxococcales bacterium]|nr:VWA domain-containing protein [Myxococcales bacterium]